MKVNEEKYDYQSKKWGTIPISSIFTNFHGLELNFFFQNTKKYITYKNFKLLDLGCGGGSVTGYLKQKCPGWSIYGLYISYEALKVARKKYPKIKFVQATASKIPFVDSYFDAIIALDSIEHFERLDVVLSEVRRVLKKSGIFFVAVPLEKQIPTLYWILRKADAKSMEKMDKLVGHVNFFNDHEFRKLLAAYGFVLVIRRFTYHLIFSIINIGYGYFQLLLRKQIAFESGISEMGDGLVKAILTLIKKLFSLVFYIESSLFYWFPGGKGLYIFKKQ